MDAARGLEILREPRSFPLLSGAVAAADDLVPNLVVVLWDSQRAQAGAKQTDRVSRVPPKSPRNAFWSVVDFQRDNKPRYKLILNTQYSCQPLPNKAKTVGGTV